MVNYISSTYFFLYLTYSENPYSLIYFTLSPALNLFNLNESIPFLPSSQALSLKYPNVEEENYVHLGSL